MWLFSSRVFAEGKTLFHPAFQKVHSGALNRGIALLVPTPEHDIENKICAGGTEVHNTSGPVVVQSSGAIS